MKYPIGIQTFSAIIEEGYVYVDKTKGILRLLEGKVFFLSRPRRFGKSLLLSTLASIFEGRKDLFKGLYIEDKIEWKKHPVIHISLNSISNKDADLRAALGDAINANARKYDITIEGRTLGSRFFELMEKLSEQEKVVLLIDEYDKPLISFINDPETMSKNRGILKEFYGVIKDADRYLKFVFITGVSRFSKVSIFSDLNNLSDISMNKDFCDICGYTEIDIHHYFTPRIAEIAKHKGISTEVLFEKVKQRYNGYNFYGSEKMYNPWSVLNFLYTEELDNYWFETGTPTFLTQLVRHLEISPEGAIVDKSELGKLSFDSDSLNVLLYQTGYLTIDEEIDTGLFRLKHPNEEVSESFTRFLLAEYAHSTTGVVRYLAMNVRDALKSKDREKLKSALNPIFAKIPYQIFQSNAEAYYHSVLHLVFMMLNYNTESEISTNKGRIDTVLLQENEVWIFEFKLNQSAQAAYDQIIEKAYAQKYQNSGKTIYAVGVNFDSEKKQIDEVSIQQIQR